VRPARPEAVVVSVLVRPATAADLDRLEELEQAHESDRFSRAQLRYLLTRANGVTLVVDEAHGRPVLGNVIVLFRRGAGIAHLYSLTVDPQERGRGLGRLLLSHAEQAAAARGLANMQLEVRVDNATAISLYLSNGYVTTGRRPDYYADGCEALTMIKALSDSPGG
jgi:ribosomal-protein-alanine N-acetyltransferase